jgi:hypothetical protein
MSVGDETMTAISRYRLAPIDVAEAAGFGDVAADRAMAVRAARVAAAGAVSVDAVIDAHSAVGPSATAVWVAARGQPLRLDAERLIRMGDAGVAGELIDVVVAVSHPRSFSMGDGALITEVVAEPVGTDRPTYREPRGYLPGRGGFFDPFYGYYDPFGYGSGYRYGGYGYGYGYGYGSGYYPGVFRPVVVVVEPSSQSDGGRVVKGRGYSQSPAARTQGSGSSGSSTGSTSPAPAPSASSGGPSTPAPAPRTAQPRDPPPGG